MARLSTSTSPWFSTIPLGSKPGTLAITRTRPVWGSIATTEPFWPPRASIAVRWAAASSVVITSLPSRSSDCSSEKIVPNSFSSPVSSSLRNASSPVLPCSTNE